jgi:hypothetical protein
MFDWFWSWCIPLHVKPLSTLRITAANNIGHGRNSNFKQEVSVKWKSQASISAPEKSSAGNRPFNFVLLNESGAPAGIDFGKPTACQPRRNRRHARREGRGLERKCYVVKHMLQTVDPSVYYVLVDIYTLTLIPYLPSSSQM